MFFQKNHLMLLTIETSPFPMFIKMEKYTYCIANLILNHVITFSFVSMYQYLHKFPQTCKYGTSQKLHFLFVFIPKELVVYRKPTCYFQKGKLITVQMIYMMIKIYGCQINKRHN